MGATIELAKQALSIAGDGGASAAAKEEISKKLQEKAKEASEALIAASRAAQTPPSAGSKDNEIQMILDNAIQQKQQLSVTADAVLTQGIATMFSLVTATLGMSVKDALEHFKVHVEAIQAAKK